MQLTTPVMAFGAAIKELTFRKPTAKDVRLHGYPFKIETTSEGSMIQHMNAGSIANLAAALGNVPLDAIDQLTPEDFMAVTGEILNFFGASQPKTNSSTGAGNSPGSSQE